MKKKSDGNKQSIIRSRWIQPAPLARSGAVPTPISRVARSGLETFRGRQTGGQWGRVSNHLTSWDYFYFWPNTDTTDSALQLASSGTRWPPKSSSRSPTSDPPPLFVSSGGWWSYNPSASFNRSVGFSLHSRFASFSSPRSLAFCLIRFVLFVLCVLCDTVVCLSIHFGPASPWFSTFSLSRDRTRRDQSLYRSLLRSLFARSSSSLLHIHRSSFLSKRVDPARPPLSTSLVATSIFGLYIYLFLIQSVVDVVPVIQPRLIKDTRQDVPPVACAVGIARPGLDASSNSCSRHPQHRRSVNLSRWFRH